MANQSSLTGLRPYRRVAAQTTSVLGKYLADRGPHLAAMVAYYALLSLFPFLFLTMSVLGLFGRVVGDGILGDDAGDEEALALQDHTRSPTSPAKTSSISRSDGASDNASTRASPRPALSRSAPTRSQTMRSLPSSSGTGWQRPSCPPARRTASPIYAQFPCSHPSTGRCRSPTRHLNTPARLSMRSSTP